MKLNSPDASHMCCMRKKRMLLRQSKSLISRLLLTTGESKLNSPDALTMIRKHLMLHSVLNMNKINTQNLLGLTDQTMTNATSNSVLTLLVNQGMKVTDTRVTINLGMRIEATTIDLLTNTVLERIITTLITRTITTTSLITTSESKKNIDLLTRDKILTTNLITINSPEETTNRITIAMKTLEAWVDNMTTKNNIDHHTFRLLLLLANQLLFILTLH